MKGKREFKYNELTDGSIKKFEWNKLNVKTPNYFFVKKDFSSESTYTGFSIGDLYITNGAGVQTKRDNLFIDIDKDTLGDRISRLLNNSLSESEKIDLNIKNSSSYRLMEKISIQKYHEGMIRKFNYRVFDDRNIYYDKNLLGRAFYNVMQNMLDDNLGLIICKQQSTFDFQHSFITKHLTDHNSISLQTKEASFLFPLYLYPESSSQQTIDQTAKRMPNLNPEIVNQIANNLGLKFTNEKEEKMEENASPVCYVSSPEVREGFEMEKSKSTFAPIDILDYIYALLHSPTYREKYKEFLKIDLPKLPYPKDQKTFWRFVELGGEIRQIHLLESSKVSKYVTQYPIDGNNIVNKVKYKDSKVYINENQYFSNVPSVAWEFYIGGYQPAQKWLKDRRGRELNFEDIGHYQKIIVALSETDRLMKKIDAIDFE